MTSQNPGCPLPLAVTGQPTHASRSREFPDSRENSRECGETSDHFGAFRRFWRPFALQFQCAADNSLLYTQQRIFVAGSGNDSPEQGKTGIAPPIDFRAWSIRLAESVRNASDLILRSAFRCVSKDGRESIPCIPPSRRPPKRAASSG